MDAFNVFQIADADAFAFITYVCMHACHIYIWHPLILAQNPRSNTRHETPETYRSNAPTRAQAGGGVPYIQLHKKKHISLHQWHGHSHRGILAFHSRFAAHAYHSMTICVASRASFFKIYIELITASEMDVNNWIKALHILY